jgi:transcription antitermination factor NusG
VHLDNLSTVWFALQVKPRFEKSAAVVLQSKGYEYLLPTYRPKTRAAAGSAERPLFPGYVFCRFDPEIRNPIVTTPGVIRIVGCGKTPACLDDGEIEALRAIDQAGVEAEPHPYLRIGEAVCVTEGPLRGIEGIVVGSGEASRLVVSVTLLQRSVAVQIRRDALAPVTEKRFLSCGGMQL